MDLLSHPGWRQVSPDPANPVYRRPLGHLELGFYWDSAYNGVAVSVNYLEVEAAPGLEDRLFSRENVEHAWLRLKQRFPLLGASVEEESATRVDFVLRPNTLRVINPGEVNFLEDLNTAQDVARVREEFRNGPNMLDNDVLARIWLGPQKDSPRRWHLFIPVAHQIMDGVACGTIMRELCQELASLSQDIDADIVPLESRLQRLLPTEAFTPGSKLSMPRRRWRFAIAKVIKDIRDSRMTGGHTLPTLPTPLKPPRSRTIGIEFTMQESLQIMRTCRSMGVSFGNALSVLSQLAFARVLYRLRYAGTIGNEEWEFRLRQPMHYMGPMNHRPYLDHEWYTGGGAEEVCIAVSTYMLTLPSLPRPATSILDATGAPPLDTLLSPARFRLRAHLARSQMKAFISHPLFHELQALSLPSRNEAACRTALAWRAQQRVEQGPAVITSGMPKYTEQISPVAPRVFANGGASLGSRDHAMPECYPLYSTKPGPQGLASEVRLRFLRMAHDLRCREGELYLGAITWRGKLHVATMFDENTYDSALVRTWTEEVKGAALFFLAGSSVEVERVDSALARL